MEMHQLRYFLALSETLNFTRAAENCNVSQPSLTRAIKALEDEFGGSLFRRERNNTHLTELGQIVLPFLKDVSAQSRAARDRAHSFAKLKETPLTLGVMCTIGPNRLIDLVRDFQTHNPGVELSLADANGQEIEKRLVEGALDVAIYGLPQGIDERFHGLPLLTERFFIVVAPGHRFETLNAVRLKDLDGERYLARVNCEYGTVMRQVLAEHGVDIRHRYRSERDDWIQSMIAAGMGYGFFPESAITLPGLVTRPLIEPEVSRTVNLVTVRGRAHSPAVGALVREAKAHKWM